MVVDAAGIGRKRRETSACADGAMQSKPGIRRDDVRLNSRRRGFDRHTGGQIIPEDDIADIGGSGRAAEHCGECRTSKQISHKPLLVLSRRQLSDAAQNIRIANGNFGARRRIVEPATIRAANLHILVAVDLRFLMDPARLQRLWRHRHVKRQFLELPGLPAFLPPDDTHMIIGIVRPVRQRLVDIGSLQRFGGNGKNNAFLIFLRLRRKAGEKANAWQRRDQFQKRQHRSLSIFTSPIGRQADRIECRSRAVLTVPARTSGTMHEAGLPKPWPWREGSREMARSRYLTSGLGAGAKVLAVTPALSPQFCNGWWMVWLFSWRTQSIGQVVLNLCYCCLPR